MVLDGVNKPYLMIGGGDHRVGHKQNYDEIFDDLENFARKLPAQLGPVECRWSGQVVEPVDGLPFIGRATNFGDRVLFATGLSGMGMTQSAIAAKVCADIILAQDETERNPKEFPTSQRQHRSMCHNFEQYRATCCCSYFPREVLDPRPFQYLLHYVLRARLSLHSDMRIA